MSDLYWQPPFDPERSERRLIPSWKPHVDEAAPIIVGKREVWDTEPAHEYAFPEAEAAEGEQRDFYRRAIRQIGRSS